MYFRDLKKELLRLGSTFFIPKNVPGCCHSPLSESTKSENRPQTSPPLELLVYCNVLVVLLHLFFKWLKGNNCSIVIERGMHS